MRKINVDGLELTDRMITELKKWYRPSRESEPELWLLGMEDIKNTFITLLCDESNETYLKDITGCLRQILIIEESLRELIPDRTSN